jgi:putative lipoprotein
MPAPRAIFPLALLGLLGGCSLFQSDDTPRAPGGERLQGDLRWNGDQLLFRPCQEQRFFDVTDANNTAILRDAHELAADSGAASLFADLRGKLKSGGRDGAQGVFAVTDVYRVQYSGPGCSDPNFKRTAMNAGGHGPDWSVQVSNQGMLISTAGQQRRALPFVQEELPGGMRALSTEANGEKVELWINPRRCVDGRTGTVQSLQAELRINGQTWQGCAFYGGAGNPT